MKCTHQNQHAAVNFEALELLSCQGTQGEENAAYVQPYWGKICDICRFSAIKENVVTGDFWSGVQMGQLFAE